MAEDLNSFIKRNRSLWQETERLLETIEEEGLQSLSEPQVKRFGELYRTISSQLILVQSQFSNPETEDYLNDLVARGYSLIYQGRKNRLRAVWEFFAADFPRIARAHVKFILASVGLFVIGLVFGIVAGVVDPDSVHYIVPGEYTNISPDEYLKSKGSLTGAEESALMMGHITTNNLRVAILCFASGITFGVGTVMVMFFNGVFMGSFMSIFIRVGKNYELCSLLAPHGLIEVSAIMISGAAGFILAGAVLFPGERTRLLALREEGRTALKLFLGTVPIFLVAMVIESTVAKFHWVGAELKYALGFAALLAMLSWLLLCGRQKRTAKNPVDKTV
jgi:uncharacterized membrane protein SpoIIM required for sporulation